MCVPFTFFLLSILYAFFLYLRLIFSFVRLLYSVIRLLYPVVRLKGHLTIKIVYAIHFRIRFHQQMFSSSVV